MAQLRRHGTHFKLRQLLRSGRVFACQQKVQRSYRWCCWCRVYQWWIQCWEALLLEFQNPPHVCQPHWDQQPGFWNLKTLDLAWHSGNSNQVKNLLENQSSLDTLRLDFTDFAVENFQLDLHPELKVRRLFMQYYNVSASLTMEMALQFRRKVEYFRIFWGSRWRRLEKSFAKL